MISKLPLDLLENIFTYLDGFDFVSLSHLNKKMYQRMYPIGLLYKLRVVELWPKVTVRLFQNEFNLEQLDSISLLLKLMKWKVSGIAFLNDIQPTMDEFEKLEKNVGNLLMFKEDIFTEIHIIMRNGLLLDTISKNISVYGNLKTLRVDQGLTNDFFLSLIPWVPNSKLTTLQISNDDRNIDSSLLGKLFSILPTTRISTLILNINPLGSNWELAGSLGIDSSISIDEFVEITKVFTHETIIQIEGPLALACVLPHTKITELGLNHFFFQRLSPIFLISKGILPKVKKFYLQGRTCSHSYTLAQGEISETAFSLIYSELEYIFSGLHSSQLEEIEFIGTMGFETVINLINNLPVSKLRRLKGDIPTNRFKDFLQVESDLKELHLIGKDSDEKCKVILENIQHLNYEKFTIQITLNGLEPLISKLDMCTLKHLDLSNSDFGNSATPTLGIYLPISKLETLSLRNCGIGDAGAKCISNFVHYTTLVSLDLRENDISLDAIKAFNRTVDGSIVRSVDGKDITTEYRLKRVKFSKKKA
ncbi:hypothetical protein HK103_007664 [Boothiomyces macroporosus]|uniref:F-box domain-containing protein n=1 Tax=Boothiomyces macroporosus TaxID=261099 RepID=A0AAD5Y5R4_9FUNG|nr:hypothetical protein HK103_007664 [Boothiomyces macroporosus]